MFSADGKTSPQSHSEASPQILLTGLLALLSSLIFVVMLAEVQRYPYSPPFHNGIVSPVLAIELARNKEDLEDVLQRSTAVAQHQAKPDGEQVQPSARVDSLMRWEAVSSLTANTVEDLAFIPLYAFFIFCFARLSASDRTAAVVSTMVGVLIFTAAVFDYLEDVGIFCSLQAQQLTDTLARCTRSASVAKWGLIAVCLLLLAVILLRASTSIYRVGVRRLAAGFCAVSGLLMLVGLLFPRLMFPANLLFGIFVLMNAVVLLRKFWVEAPAIHPQ